MNRILAVDGNNLLFQMFFGMPSRIVNEKGKPIQGTLGFIGALLKIIGITEPTHLVVLFDGQHENPRKKLNSNYKANRTDFSKVSEEKNPFSQLADIYKALDYLGISHKETTVCEADDCIAGYALKYGEQCKIIISSFDSDFFQLINNNVSVLRYRGKNTVICTPDYIRDKFKISPQQYVDFKSLTGDRCDNIRGADKIGVKTAANLLAEFENLENIIINAEKIEKPSIKKSIKENAEMLRVNYKLIKLDGTCNLPFALTELEYTPLNITTYDVLKAIGLRQ